VQEVGTTSDVPSVQVRCVRLARQSTQGGSVLPSELLTPVLRTDRPGADADVNEVRYFLSFMRLRTYVGVLGLALPVLVPLVDKIVFSGDPAPRGSISAYYYSGARELFVAILAATGVFMISYKVAERDLDNLLSVLSGFAAVFIALFPTGRPATKPPLTPLQELIGENWTKYIHYTATSPSSPPSRHPLDHRDGTFRRAEVFNPDRRVDSRLGLRALLANEGPRDATTSTTTRRGRRISAFLISFTNSGPTRSA
jgi:hypothetical protein